MSSQPLNKLEELTSIPNLLTYGRILAIPVCLLFISWGDPWWSFMACVVFGAAALTDFFDGWLARRMGLTSVIGKFLDPLADKLIVMSTLVMMVHTGRVPAWVVVVMLAREMTISSLRSIASAEGIIMGASYAGKIKTALQLTAILFLLIHYSYRINFVFWSMDVNCHAVGLPILYISLAVSLYSAGEYLRDFYHHLYGAPSKPAS